MTMMAERISNKCYKLKLYGAECIWGPSDVNGSREDIASIIGHLLWICGFKYNYSEGPKTDFGGSAAAEYERRNAKKGRPDPDYGAEIMEWCNRLRMPDNRRKEGR